LWAPLVGAVLTASLVALTLPLVDGFFVGQQFILQQFGSALAAGLLGVAYAVVGVVRKSQGAHFMPGLGLGIAVGSASAWPLLANRFGMDSISLGLWTLLPVALLAFGLMRAFKQKTVSAKTGGALSLLAIVAGAVPLATSCIPLWLAPPDPAELRELPGAVTTAQADAPDILLISLDTLRADAVIGPESADVPFLDQLRERGTWSDHARSSSNCTLPGHIGMLRGLGALEHGVIANHQESISSKHATLAASLTEAGYRTLGLPSNPIMLTGTGVDRGFLQYDDTLVVDNAKRYLLKTEAARYTLAPRVLPQWLFRRFFEGVLFGMPPANVALPIERERSGETLERSLRWLDKIYEDDSPYFFFLHFVAPHAPYSAPIGFRGMYSNKDTPSRSPERYLEEVAYSDYLVQQVVERVEASGRPCLILVTSDHGEHLGEHVSEDFEKGIWGHTNSGFEELLRVPFILVGPNVPAGEISTPHLEDVAPTLLDLAGLSIPEGMSGVSIFDPSFASRESLHFARERGMISIQVEDWKWIVEPPALPDEMLGQGRVYLLSEDPKEQTDRLPAALPAALRDRALGVYAAAEPVRFERASGKERQAALTAMGYVID